MTRVIRPTEGTEMSAAPFAAAIKWAGFEDWVVELGEDYATHTVPELESGEKGGFQQYGTDGLEMTIASGEAFVGGCYVAADETTTFEVEDNSISALYLGFSRSGPDQFRFGDSSIFGSDDPRVHLFGIVSEDGEITQVNDVRPLGEPTLGSGKSSGTIPMTRLRPGERACNYLRVSSDETFHLVRSSLLDENGDAPYRLHFQIRDLETGSQFFSTSEARSSRGSLDDPLESISGSRSLELSMYNRTDDTTHVGSVSYDYILEEE